MVFMVARIGERAAVSGARKASRRPRSPDPRGEGNGTGVKGAARRVRTAKTRIGSRTARTNGTAAGSPGLRTRGQGPPRQPENETRPLSRRDR